MKKSYSIRLKRRKNNTWKIVLIAAVAAAVIFALVYFIFFSGRGREEEKPLDVVSIIDIDSTAVTAETTDISDRQNEARIRSNSINYPYAFGNEIIYSSRRNGKCGFKRLII